jgi:hypothetical protein
MSAQRLALVCHPATPSLAVQAIEVEADWAELAQTRLTYRVRGEPNALVIPPPAGAVGTDELWRTTCFEAFFRASAAPSYVEFNFAPSGAWAAYRFDGYRAGMAPLEIAPPSISFALTASGCEQTVVLALPYDAEGRLSLTAVIEERGGRKSYWALEHQGEQPDFHNFIGVSLP